MDQAAPPSVSRNQCRAHGSTPLNRTATKTTSIAHQLHLAQAPVGEGVSHGLGTSGLVQHGFEGLRQLLGVSQHVAAVQSFQPKLGEELGENQNQAENQNGIQKTNCTLARRRASSARIRPSSAWPRATNVTLQRR